MCQWKVMASIIPMLATSFLFLSCGRKCAPYPENMAKFMPVQYNGGELKYLIGKDTCFLTVETLLLDNGYKLTQRDLDLMDYCESFATQSVGNKDSYLIEYTQRRAMEGVVVQYSMNISHMERQQEERVQFSYDFEDTAFGESFHYKIFSEYTASTGKTYGPVLFWVDWTKDSVWVSYDEGLVRYVPAQSDSTALGQVWQLL